MHHGAVNSASRNTAPVSRTSLSTSESASKQASRYVCGVPSMRSGGPVMGRRRGPGNSSTRDAADECGRANNKRGAAMKVAAPHTGDFETYRIAHGVMKTTEFVP